MTGFIKFRTLLLAASMAALASCGDGPTEVASPGEGGFNGGGGTGGGAGGGGVLQPGQPAADCPAGFANVGTVANGTLRNCQLPTQIVTNLVVPNRAGTVYSISGRTDVGVDLGPDPNAPVAGGQRGILTVEPGVRIFGSAGADYIIVNRGSQIFAEGTATSPIVFTSRQSIDGQTNVDSIGQWGGLIIAGRAPTNSCPSGVTPPNVQCVAATEGTTALHGGNAATDNSGILRYVRVQHSGFVVVQGRELNGITLAGVGNGTTIDHVQIHNSSDDGFEMFGGTVNLRHIVLTGNDDDSLDTDNGYRGAIQFLIVQQRSGGGDRMFEMSCAGAQALCSRPQISNATLIGRSTSGATEAIILNSGTDLDLLNSVVTGSPVCLRVDGDATEAAQPTFNSVYMSCATPFSTSSSSIGAARIGALFNAGANNVSNGTSTLQNGFINGTNESGRPATNPTTVNPFFQAVNYIGAVRDASDTWWQGWTCGLTAGSTC